MIDNVLQTILKISVIIIIPAITIGLVGMIVAFWKIIFKEFFGR